MELNNREIALVVWAGLALLWMFSFRDVRRGWGSLIGMLVRPPIGVALLGFIASVISLVVLASWLGVWRPELTNETVLWFLAVGLALFFNIDAVAEQQAYFGRAIRSALPAALFVEVFIGIVVLPLPLELLLLPVATLLTAVLVVAESRKEYEPAERAISSALAYIGLGLLAFVALSLLVQPTLFDAGHTMRAMVLPIWLTLGVLPFLYLLGLYAAYEGAFKRIHVWRCKPAARWPAMLALLSILHVRAHKVGAFNGPWLREITEAQSYGEARSVVGRYLNT